MLVQGNSNSEVTRQTLLWLQAVRAQCGVAIDAAVRLLTPLATDFPASARAAARLKKTSSCGRDCSMYRSIQSALFYREQANRGYENAMETSRQSCAIMRCVILRCPCRLRGEGKLDVCISPRYRAPGRTCGVFPLPAAEMPRPFLSRPIWHFTMPAVRVAISVPLLPVENSNGRV